jgi:hypothetical protein
MRWLLSFGLLLLALGTLRTVGCGDASPCGDCGDGNPCTTEKCVFVVWTSRGPTGWQCDYNRVWDGTPCGSGCGSGKVCVDGVCVENPCAGCVDDGNPCTEHCDYKTGACNNPWPRRGDSCVSESGHTGRCSEDGVCIVCEELDCDDGDLCTTDHCTEAYQSGYFCEHYPVRCDHQCALCDPETGECYESLAEGHLCNADDELGISVDWDRSMYGLCESGRCTGQPCDLTSEEVYPCPVESDAFWAPFCCPWEHLPDHPRGYCMATRTCWEARCLTECPSTVAECMRQGGVCPGE